MKLAMTHIFKNNKNIQMFQDIPTNITKNILKSTNELNTRNL